MTPLIVYPVPMDRPDVWELFRPFVQRFADTLRKYPPGCEYGLIAVVNNSEVTNELHEIFDGLPINFMRYDGQGADIGSFRAAAKVNPGAFLVCCVSRVYFHREGWLAEIKDCRQAYGPGLYGTSASHEGGPLHLCTRCYAMDARLWNEYPVEIVSRDQGTFFEIGRDNPVGPLSTWVRSLGKTVLIVYWDDAYELEDAFKPDNIFRRGSQSNLLVLDKHSDAWANASPEEKDRLSRLAFGELRP